MFSRNDSPEYERWLENFARFGIICKGVVYCLIGILSGITALGLAGRKAGKIETLELIHHQPFGKLLLVVIAAGLFGYVTWRFFQAVEDIDGKGSSTRGIVTRLGYGLSALVYFSIAVFSLKLCINGSGNNGFSTQEFIISKVLAYQAGEYLIGAVAVLIIFNGGRQIYSAVTGDFMKNVQLRTSGYFSLFRRTGTAGYTSRGIVLLIIGYFFMRAAIDSNPVAVQNGTQEAFEFLEDYFGSFLMGVVAIGLLGYGLFMFVKGKYQKIDLNF